MQSPPTFLGLSARREIFPREPQQFEVAGLFRDLLEILEIVFERLRREAADQPADELLGRLNPGGQRIEPMTVRQCDAQNPPAAATQLVVDRIEIGLQRPSRTALNTSRASSHRSSAPWKRNATGVPWPRPVLKVIAD